MRANINIREANNSFHSSRWAPCIGYTTELWTQEAKVVCWLPCLWWFAGDPTSLACNNILIYTSSANGEPSQAKRGMFKPAFVYNWSDYGNGSNENSVANKWTSYIKLWHFHSSNSKLNWHTSSSCDLILRYPGWCCVSDLSTAGGWTQTLFLQ